MSGYNPPSWLERIILRALPAGLSAQSTLGDLAEDFERRALKSPARARLWYAAQTSSIVLYRVFTGSGDEKSTGDSDLLMDLRWSIRSVFKHPGFSFGLVAVLGLGLGANAAVYSVVDGTLRNTSWWAEPDAAVAVWPGHGFSYGQIKIYQDETTAYRSLGLYGEAAFAVQTPDGESQSVGGVYITPELFRELAVQPRLGRALIDDDAILGVEPVVVIGDALWKQVFAADPSIIGRQITISGRAVTVVGVQGPDGVAPGGRTEVWIPQVFDPRDDDYWMDQGYTMIGVLRDGGDLDDASADLDAYTATLTGMFASFYPEGWADGLAHVTRADEAQRSLIATPLMLLMVGTALLMLVTALNVGNLLLGRAIDRRKELAVRASLGAGRGRIVRQLLVEGLVLTVLALGVGLVSGTLGGEWIEKLFVGEAVVARSSVLSPSVLVFLLGVSALAWMVLNGVPVAHYLRSQRSRLNVMPSSGSGIQKGLVTVQAALATLLLVSATLLVATVDNLRRVPLGFDPGGIVTVELSPPADRVATVPEARDLYERLTERVGALPGVKAVGLTGWLPLRAQAPNAPINLQAAPVSVRAESETAPKHMVDPGFFEAMGIQPLEGRLLRSEDRAAEPSAVVVNESLARLLWPTGGAVGQLIAIDPHAWTTWLPVVGVVQIGRAHV